MKQDYLRLQSTSRHNNSKGEVSYLIAPERQWRYGVGALFEKRKSHQVEEEYLATRERSMKLVQGLNVKQLSSTLNHFPKSIYEFLRETSKFYLKVIFLDSIKKEVRDSYEEMLDSRKYIDDRVVSRFSQVDIKGDLSFVDAISYGIQLELRLQEVIMSCIQELLCSSQNSSSNLNMHKVASDSIQWVRVEGGLINFGADEGKCALYDEFPMHTRFIYPFKMSHRLVTNSEYIEFIEDKGYENRSLWEREGWKWKEKNGISKPLYWEGNLQHTIHGSRPIDMSEPVSNVSYYEAAAFANWSGSRLATEFEWEAAAKEHALKEGYKV